MTILIIEIFAVVFGLLYIILASLEKIWCWLFGLISVILYMFIFLHGDLYGQFALQFFYLIMSVYGFFMWKKPDKTKIKEWPIWFHLLIIFLGSILSLILGFIFSEYTNSAHPSLDALITIFSLFATIMVTKKILENWLYWILLDILLCYLCFSISSYVAASQFIIFTIIAIFGYFSWNKKMRQNV